MDHAVQWVSPSPLWLGKSDLGSIAAPQLLGFRSDDFMEELKRTLTSAPAELARHVAVWESASEPSPGASPAYRRAPETLKLYQPVHGRYYLIAASLVCRLPGLPDRHPDPAREERLAFLLRRVRGGDELAWTSDPVDSTKKRWTRVEPGHEEAVAPGEESFALFMSTFTYVGKTRRVYTGFVPTASRETFEVPAAVPPTTAPRDSRVDRVIARVLLPYRAMREQGQSPVFPGAGDTAAVEAAQKEASLFLLLDLADALAADAPALLGAIARAEPPALPGARALYDLLDAHRVEPDSSETWRAALARLFAEQASNVERGLDRLSEATFNLARSTLSPEALEVALSSAFPGDAAPGPGSGEIAVVAKLGEPGAEYVIRCVFFRPRCAGLKREVVSAPSVKFRLAQYFDPDAPARRIRIPMPFDTGIGALRRFPKGVGFVLSAQFRKQLCRVTDLKKVLDGRLAECDEPELPGGFAEICSISIPILTMCALIVLMIFVSLLNIVFWWLPFLKVCRPIALTPGSEP